jgi:catechol 2,3-dioxygenase-like lactoylglutathione lyase family enzyme
MTVTALDHLYVETTNWAESVSFWERLGFRFVARWGSEGHRAGRLIAGSAVVVLAEVAAAPEFTVFFAVPDSPQLEPTHWGTRMARATDPDGRTVALEATP